MAGIPAALAGVSGIMDIVNSARRMGGKRRVKKKCKKCLPCKAGEGLRYIRRNKLYRRRKRRGRGIVADVFGGIPLLGSILGPIVKAMGGKRIRGRGLVDMAIKRPYYRGGLLAPAGGYRHKLISYSPIPLLKHIPSRGFSGMGMASPNLKYLYSIKKRGGFRVRPHVRRTMYGPVRVKGYIK
jgi:hypothetical protein